MSTSYTRAAPGGMGAAKTGGNYAASLVAQQEAAEHGCEQVMFADAAEHRWVEELGGMNLYLVTSDHQLITPELTGSILEGVTRDSILTLATEFGLTPWSAGWASTSCWRASPAAGWRSSSPAARPPW
jgi:branched-chain amino acid aminotransferase